MASTTDSTTTTIIKSDRIGRSHYRPQYKAEVLAAYRESGMSGHAFAEQCGIKSTPFHPPSLRSKSGFKAPRQKQIPATTLGRNSPNLDKYDRSGGAQSL